MATTKIVNGPSKFDFGIAFLDRFGPAGSSKSQQRTVTLTVQSRVGQYSMAEVLIDSLSWDCDGSGHSFKFSGRLTPDSSYQAHIEFKGIQPRGVHGHYDTKRHEGTIGPYGD